MKRGHVFGLASIAVALAAACGGVNSAGDDGGVTGSASGGSSSAFSSGGTAGSSSGAFSTGGSTSSSGTASSGGRSASSGGGSSGAGSTSSSGSGGRRDAGGGSSGGLVRNNRCPNCPGSQVCCLAPMGGNLSGSCAATAAACPSGAASIACTGGDCNGGQVCCVTLASGGGPSSTSCQASCPSGSPPSCGGMPGDNADCPGGPSGWACQPVPGTPGAVLGQCVPAEGGAPPGDGGDATVTDSSTTGDSGASPQDAAGEGG